MKTKLALGAIAAAVAVFSQGAFAQASSPTRAEVKAQAKTGALAPAGQGENAMGDKGSKTSDTTRADRKASTKAARSAGTLKPAGEGAEMKADKDAAKQGTTKNRADRKAETKAAVKAGTTTPAGEAPNPQGESQKK